MLIPNINKTESGKLVARFYVLKFLPYFFRTCSQNDKNGDYKVRVLGSCMKSFLQPSAVLGTSFIPFLELTRGGNLLRMVPPQKKGGFLKFCFHSTLKVSNITLMVLGLKSHNRASSFLLTLSVIANYLIMSRRYLLLFF